MSVVEIEIKPMGSPPNYEVFAIASARTETNPSFLRTFGMASENEA